jgi:hypothetical protein
MPNSRSQGARNNNRRIRRRTTRRRGISSWSSELGMAGSLVGASALFQGTELQQNSFHEQQDTRSDLMLTGGRGNNKHITSRGCANDIADHILCFLELLNTIKIYHWSTLSYPTHKATDELHGKLSELVDSFIEIYIGHCARGGQGADAGVPRFRFKSEKDASIEFCECKTQAAFCKVLDDNIVHLEGLTKRLNGHTDLVNIRDEMVGALAQALYLLRLK